MQVTKPFLSISSIHCLADRQRYNGEKCNAIVILPRRCPQARITPIAESQMSVALSNVNAHQSIIERKLDHGCMGG